MNEIISPLDLYRGSLPSTDGSPRAAQQGPGFADRLGDAFRAADADHRTAEANAAKLAAGDGDVIETMVTLSKADLSLRMAVNLRNRALEAYNEIMRLSI